MTIDTKDQRLFTVPQTQAMLKPPKELTPKLALLLLPVRLCAPLPLQVDWRCGPGSTDSGRRYWCSRVPAPEGLALGQTRKSR